MPRGGPRSGSGRRPGTPNARSAIEAIRAVAERHPGWHPLLQMADVANDADLPIELRLDACKSAARWMIPPPKPVELEPDAVVDLERRLVRVRIEAHAAASSDPGITALAERLERARRREVIVITGVSRAPDDPILGEIADTPSNAECRSCTRRLP